MSKKSGLVGILLLIAFAVLLFVSKTYYSRNLPEVMGVMPAPKKLTKEEKAYGTAQWSDTFTKYAELSGTVKEIFVDDNSFLEEGAPVLAFTFQLDELRYNLRQLALDFEKNQLDEQNIHAKIASLQREIAEAKSETDDEIEPFEQEPLLTLELERLNVQLADAKQALEDGQKLYAAGAVAVSELETLQKNLTNIENLITVAETNIKKARQQYEKTLKQSNKETEQQNKERAKQIESLNDSIDAARRELQALSLNGRALSLNRERLNSQLTSFDGKEVVNAPVRGKILNLFVNPGQIVSQGSPLFELGCGDVMDVTVSLSVDNDFVNIGTDALLRDLTSLKDYGAKVTKIEEAEHERRVTISANAEDINSGRTYEAIIQKTIATEYTTIPNSAVNKDSNGYFVYMIKQRDGALGKEFYIQKFAIQIIDSDDTNTAIEPILQEPIMYISNKPVVSNMSVRLMNEGDFVVEQ